MAKGNLIVNVYGESIANPIKDAKGQTESITLDTVNKSFSEEEQFTTRPYETYDLTINALGLTNTKVEGVQIFDGITSIQNVYLTSIDENENEDIQEITPNS